MTVMSIFRLSSFFKNVRKKHNSSYSSLSSDSSQDLLFYLTKSKGFRSEEAAKLCQKLRSFSIQKLEGLSSFLSESGFTDDQIKKTISLNPQLLRLKVEKTLMPKMKAFQDLGLSANEIAEMVERNPRILNSSLKKSILPTVGILQTVIPGEKNLPTAIKSLLSRFRATHNVEMLEINLSKLRNRGVPCASLSTVLVKYPTIFQTNPSSLERTIEKVHQFGFDYSSGMFLYALKTLGGMKESTWDAKLKVFKGFGWSEQNIITAFQKSPYVMDQSISYLQKKLEFFMNELKFSADVLASAPTLLMFSFEKRVIPRITVMRELESRELLNRKWTLTTIMAMPEKKFCKKFVLEHKVMCPEVVRMYGNHNNSHNQVEN